MKIFGFLVMACFIAAAVSAFAGGETGKVGCHTTEAENVDAKAVEAATAACKAEGKKDKDLEDCVKGKTQKTGVK